MLQKIGLRGDGTNINLKGNFTTVGDVTVGDDLTVTDDASVGGDLTVTDSVEVGGVLRAEDVFVKALTVTSEISTADAVTYTAAQVLGGYIIRDPAGGARSDVTPTAALLIAAIDGAAVGDSFEFIIENTADEAETITITAGVGVTLSGTMTIAQNYSKRFLAVVTAADAVTIYNVGTFLT
jgi:hypothetical protein